MLELKEFEFEHLELTYNWLHDPELKELTASPDFTRNDQLIWFNSLNDRNDYKIFIIKFNKEAIGACGIKNIENSIGEYWTYIGNKSFWGKGLGKEIYLLTEEEGKKLGLEKFKIIIGNPENTRSIELHKKMGFQIMEDHGDYLIMLKSLK